MAMIGEDCYFYYNSTCARGDSCTYRHQPAARNTTEICQNWLKGSCFKPSCTLRHIVANFQSSASGDQSKMQCYWERQPSGCLKQNCPYFHSLRNSPLPVGSPAVAAMPAVLPPSIGIASHLPAVQLSGSPFVGQPLPGNGLNVNAPGAIFIGRGLTVVNQPSPLIGGPTLLRGPVPNLPASLLQSTTVSAPSSELSAPVELTVSESTASLRKDFEKVVPRGATIHIKPSIARLMAPQAQAQAPGYAPVLGPLPNNIVENVLPGVKQEHFGEQVRLFKEMLAGKSPISAVAKPSELTMNSKERFSPVEHDLSDEWSDVDNKELSRGKRHDDGRRVESHREKSRKRRRDRRGQDHSSSSHHRKAFSRSSGRLTLSKADQELLEGDYKDVPLHSDRKSVRRKRTTSAAHSDGELDLHVKPLEQVLREKAIRRMAERSGSKDLRDSGEGKEVTSDRLPASDDDIQRAGRRGRSSKRSTKSATVDSEIAAPVQPPPGDEPKAEILCDGARSESNEELGVARPAAESVGVNSEDSAAKQEESSTMPHAGEAGVSEDADMAYASDGTDVSLDVPDEEIESLHMPVDLKNVPSITKPHDDAAAKKSRRSSKSKPRSVRKPSSGFDKLDDKKLGSGASFASRDVAATYERQTNNRRRLGSSDNRRNRVSKPQPAQVKTDKKAQLLTGQPPFDKKPCSLEKVVAVKQTLTGKLVGNAVVATAANEGKSFAKESSRVADSLEIPGRSAVPAPPQQKPEISTAGGKVHVKSFEEIMAEKRRRKFGAPEVHVISDDGDGCDPVVKPAFGGTSKKVAASVTNLRSKSEATKATVLSKPVAALHSPRLGAQDAVGSSDGDAKKAAERRVKVARKSIQLYKPPVKEGPATIASSSDGNGSTPDVILNGSNPSSRLAVSSSSSKTTAKEDVSVANTARLVRIRHPSSDSAPVVSKVHVKSFADIMQEKRLRRQHHTADSSVVAQESSSFSLRRHRFLKKPTSLIASTSDPSPESLDDTKLVAGRVSNVARVSPFNKTDASELSKSDTASLVVVKQSRPEVAIADDSSLSVGADADLLFKSSVSVEDAKPSLAGSRADNGELSRSALAKDVAAPRLSQALNDTERAHPVERRSGSVTHSGVVAVSTHQPPSLSFYDKNAGAKNVKDSLTASPDVNDSGSNCSFKDIQQALETKRRQREEDLLSDEELKKEFDDLSSAGDDDMDEDDLMMEIEDMIGDD